MGYPLRAGEDGVEGVVPGSVNFHLFGRPCRVFAPCEDDVVRDVDDCECTTRLVSQVRARIVEVAAVVESDATGLHLHWNGVGDIVSSFLHLPDDRLAFDAELDTILFTELVRSRTEVETAVLNRYIVDGDPSGRVSLAEVQCDTWGGFVWYTMDPDASPLADFLNPIPDLTRTRDLDQMVRVVWRTFTVDANWKFASDNFNESYHLPTVHPQLSTTTDEDYKNTIFESYASGHNRMIEQGQPSMRAPSPNEVEEPFDQMLRDWELDPKDFEGRSRDGRLALQKQRRELGPKRGFKHFDRYEDEELTDFFHHTLFPNITITATAEGAHFFRTEPDPSDPEKCTFDYWFLAPKIEGQDTVTTICGVRPFEEASHESIEYGSGAIIDDMMDSFLVQDLSVAVGQQNGFHSRGYKDAILSGQESRVRRFHEIINDYIEGRR